MLGGPSPVTSADNAPVLPFGHGLTYTRFERSALTTPAAVPAEGEFEASVRVTNVGTRAGTDVVQLYAHDVYASVTRPVAQLLAFERISLEPGESAVVTFTVPTSRLAFTGREGFRIVEAGTIEVWVGASCAERETETVVDIVGPDHRVGTEDRLIVRVQTAAVGDPTRV
jgi:beta-glucosidase